MKRQRTFPSSSWRSLLLHVWLLLHCTVAGFRTSRRIFFSRYANVDSTHDVEAASSSTTTNSEKSFGSIFLVGAGPGDPELLTVGAAKILADERRKNKELTSQLEQYANGLARDRAIADLESKLQRANAERDQASASLQSES